MLKPETYQQLRGAGAVEADRVTISRDPDLQGFSIPKPTGQNCTDVRRHPPMPGCAAEASPWSRPGASQLWCYAHRRLRTSASAASGTNKAQHMQRVVRTTAPSMSLSTPHVCGQGRATLKASLACEFMLRLTHLHCTCSRIHERH